jgi:hypothetical protein
MGYEYQQKNKLLALQARERLRQEQISTDGGLFSHLVPKDATMRFRCQVDVSSGDIKAGDQVLLYKEEGGGVKVLKQLKRIGALMPEAAADLLECLPQDDSTEFHLAEIFSDPCPLDDTADIVVKAPQNQKPNSAN